MRVGSSSDSIYSLFLPRTRQDDPSESSSQSSSPSGGTFAGTMSDIDAASALQAKLAHSNFDRNDTNGDGYVDRNEYIENNMKVHSDGFQADLADVQKSWNELDKRGAGRLNEAEYTEGFNSVFQVSIGHFSKPLR